MRISSINFPFTKINGKITDGLSRWNICTYFRLFTFLKLEVVIVKYLSLSDNINIHLTYNWNVYLY